ncbi:hypothetical protein SAMN05421776_110126 [Nocardia farcinica]|uniref:Uncharacterized protein n=1 Tax=Nocardia farcinica TaxID=37329 RepID=A0A0H5NNT0_NOCFR|nr:hypothetical protein [Nocardia farcinica]AXK85699.1 hypothetical protein DXT66_08710 [Nocardia farcinica]CRY77525.1 Uncharacterised protein [Nocardia farcinica]SIT31260.1 hypothetical protein SAMN05421776_110126 [Nocardia farcinica]
MQVTWHKCGALARLLDRLGEQVYIRPLVAFSRQGLRLFLPGGELRCVVPVDALVNRLSRPSHNVRDRMPAERVARIATALENAGIVAHDGPSPQNEPTGGADGR